MHQGSSFHNNHPRGVSLILLVVLASTLMLMMSLVVDLGHRHLVKIQLQRTVDAAARYGAQGLAVSGFVARDNAIASAAENLVMGVVPQLTQQNIRVGIWDEQTRTFHNRGWGHPQLNAIEVTASQPANLLLARFISMRPVQATAIAFYTPPVLSTTYVPMTSNPWLAGMPNGTVANPGNPKNNPDYAPQCSPAQVLGVPIIPGTILEFGRSLSGGGGNFPGDATYSPDGNLRRMVWNFGGAEHGKSNVRAPINSLLGVFLGPEQPNLTPPPVIDQADCPDDFSSAAARNRLVYRPKLKQVFFIGDGKTDSGQLQQWVVPEGATRLFLGPMDGFEWNNNHGGFTMTIDLVGSVSLVK